MWRDPKKGITRLISIASFRIRHTFSHPTLNKCILEIQHFKRPDRVQVKAMKAVRQAIIKVHCKQLQVFTCSSSYIVETHFGY